METPKGDNEFATHLLVFTSLTRNRESGADFNTPESYCIRSYAQLLQQNRSLSIFKPIVNGTHKKSRDQPWETHS